MSAPGYARASRFGGGYDRWATLGRIYCGEGASDCDPPATLALRARFGGGYDRWATLGRIYCGEGAVATEAAVIAAARLANAWHAGYAIKPTQD